MTGRDNGRQPEIVVPLAVRRITSEQEAEWARVVMDKEQRLQPAADAARMAVLLLEAEPKAEMAFVPMVLPGMVPGLWTLTQPVVTVPGVVMLARGGVSARGLVTPPMVPAAVWVRQQVMRLAREYLTEHHHGEGVAAIAEVTRTGRAAVHEDTTAGTVVTLLLDDGNAMQLERASVFHQREDDVVELTGYLRSGPDTMWSSAMTVTVAGVLTPPVVIARPVLLDVSHLDGVHRLPFVLVTLPLAEAGHLLDVPQLRRGG